MDERETEHGTTKKCSVCKTDKPLSEFYKDISHLFNVRGVCKICSCAHGKEYYVKNKDKSHAHSRKTHLKKAYGITGAQYENMSNAQGGVCAICGKPESVKSRRKHWRLSVDHVTGKVRGLLCSACNASVGAFNESIDILVSAISYLLNAEYKAVGL